MNSLLTQFYYINTFTYINFTIILLNFYVEFNYIWTYVLYNLNYQLDTAEQLIFVPFPFRNYAVLYITLSKPIDEAYLGPSLINIIAVLF